VDSPRPSGFGFAEECPANPGARIFKGMANDSPSPWGEGRVEGGRAKSKCRDERECVGGNLSLPFIFDFPNAVCPALKDHSCAVFPAETGRPEIPSNISVDSTINGFIVKPKQQC
jgi:hypothetical protein